MREYFSGLPKIVIFVPLFNLTDMSFNALILNFFKSVVGTFTQFESDDSLISDETKAILSDSTARKQLSKELHNSKSEGNSKIEIEYNGKKVEFLVER